MNMTPVVSSNINAIGYDPDTNELRVEFSNGRAYRYPGVPADAYQALMAAESVGSHFASIIRPNYQGVQE